MKDHKEIEKKINTTFKNKELLTQAFVHRSYINEHPQFHLEHNERLEFLGDAVLELVVTEYLYKNYKNPEGELTNWRAALVKGDQLSRVAQMLDLEPHLLLSKGEQKSSGKAKQLIMANAFEALIGAIYLDQGYEAAQQFVNDFIIIHLKEILDKKLYLDAKSYFQELTQEKTGITPTYKVHNETGPDHTKIFEVGVYLNDQHVGTGSGLSKQEAQQKAAEDALAHWEE